MTAIRMYHNPACSTSRKVLSLIREKGFEPEIIDYLKTPPSRKELEAIAALAGGARAILREKGALYEELALADPNLSDQRLLDAIEADPTLLNRPIVVTERGAKLCRPPEAALDLLP